MPVTENSDSLDKLSMKSVSPGWCGLLVFESVWVLKLQSGAPNVTRSRLSIGRWISQWWGQSAQTLKCCFYDVNHTNRCDACNQKHPLPCLPTHTNIHTVHPPAVWLTLQCEHKRKPCLHTAFASAAFLENFSELMNTVRWEHGGPGAPEHNCPQLWELRKATL